MINVTETAATVIRQLSEKSGAPGAGLRLFVERGGCSGLQYSMTIAPPQADDLRVDDCGVSVFLDAQAQQYLKGSTIDYSFDLGNTGFKITNPNARQTCGCGTSFEARPA